MKRERTAPTNSPQRRLAAILAADMVGYSRLMEKDEAGTVARLKSDRSELIDPAISSHGGQIVHLAGHPRHPVRRVRERGGAGGTPRVGSLVESS